MSLLSRVIKSVPNGAALKNILEANNVQIYQKGQASLSDIVNEQVYKRKRHDPIYIIDVAAIIDQYMLWNNCLPQVHPFYAVKCCYTDILLKTLANLGTGFDVANKYEIDLVHRYGVSSERMIFANTIKQVNHLTHAREKGVKLMTFDNPWELDKIREAFPDADLVLRIKSTPNDATVSINFSSKFGCPMYDVKPLLEKAKKLGLNVVGVSFHVGYRCADPKNYTDAIRDAKVVFNIAEQMGYNMRILDLGGGYSGYPGDTETPFETVAEKINEALSEHFGNRKDVKMISEPGRFLASRSHILALQVIGKSSRLDNNGKRDLRYHLNDGLYGSFRVIQFENTFAKMYPLNPRSKDLKVSTLFGPTCDSTDHIGKNHLLPEMEVGDWIYFDKFGAYAQALSSYFNSYPNPEYGFIFREDSLENFEVWEKRNIAKKDMVDDQRIVYRNTNIV